MRIEGARFWNWLCYRDEHELDLGSAVYGITAEHCDNEERSNWLGKTALLEALGPFPLFGWHRKRTEDEWITKGEDEGGVELFFGNGARLKRWRQRGKATRLEFSAGGRTLTDSAAQSAVLSMLGLTEDDFFNVCYFEQKKMNRFVVARPADRQKVVTDWMQLEPLSRAGLRAVRKASDAFDRRDRLEREIAGLRARIVEITSRYPEFDGVPFGEVIDSLKQLEANKGSHIAHDRKQLDVELAKEKLAARLGEYQVALGRFGELERQHGELLRQHLPELDRVSMTATEAVVAEMRGQVEVARRDANDRRRLVVSSFGGECPVSPGFVCPAKDEINGRAEQNRAALEEASTRLKVAQEQLREKEQELQAFEKLEREIERHASQVAASERALASAKPTKPEGEWDGKAPETATVAARLTKLESELAVLKRDREAVQEIALRMVGLDEDLERAKRAAEVAAVGAKILGRNGAQRRISEGGLSQIERLANTSFVDAGIDLSCSISWGRETKGLATNCEECGAPFPTSTKVKVCERCKADRGPKVDERLELLLSDQSGAAEDMAGIALQLAASSWLRRQRHSPWSVAYIDEPFGALDTAHRRALATYFVASLPVRFGYEQVFVVAHDRGVMDALPGRIIVRGTPGGSMVELG